MYYGVEHFHLVGHSMGGLTALMLADEIRARVLSFVDIEGNHTSTRELDEEIPKRCRRDRRGDAARFRIRQFRIARHDLPARRFDQPID